MDNQQDQNYKKQYLKCNKYNHMYTDGHCYLFTHHMEAGVFLERKA
ncbi:hypothetical protein VCRA2113O325_180023 [Vibrio crassostreae]|nr:hypothetical protein [Vibrio crassostreae]CAK1822884.1 hypothetical protein VCRA2113O322_190053 [Vibrio crassostreae]CAK1945419.1 hypothetical protein VCRA2113O326_210022 [Vibrio crassostreae]CAK2669351.1 hypothetical protein VCRA2113O325_180023 [Vibrio crassostreae]CAK2726945.1 hypothetical protein VCRA2113O323_200053 [Vibrio crassostreae]CAK2741380.1 hypothetical protein VCRA2113O321_210022 [Vibrio crassostreae]